MKKFSQLFLGFVVSLMLIAHTIPVMAASSFARNPQGFQATSGEAFSLGDAVCFSGTTIFKADANDADKQPAVGFAESTVIGAGTITGVVVHGFMNGQVGLTPGLTAYLSDTAGSIIYTVVSAYPQKLGFVTSATQVQIDVDPFSAAGGAFTGTTGTFSGVITGNGGITIPGGQDTSLGNTVISSDFIAAGGFQLFLSYADDDIDSTQSAVAMTTAGSTTTTAFEMPYSGSIIGISVFTNESRSAGTLTVDATIAGSVTGLQAVLDGSNADHHSTTQVKDTDAFAAGAIIGVKYTTDAAWRPDGSADINVLVLIESGGND